MQLEATIIQTFSLLSAKQWGYVYYKAIYNGLL